MRRGGEGRHGSIGRGLGRRREIVSFDPPPREERPVTMARSSPPVPRLRSALRRWLRFAWFDSLPLVDWFRGCPDRCHAAAKRPSIEALEDRRVPGDLLSLGRAFVDMPV